jgi:hypothetical protein
MEIFNARFRTPPLHHLLVLTLAAKEQNAGYAVVP